MYIANNTLLQGGKYKIVRFIKSGGFGCTYEAEHVMLRKKVAIKEFFVKDFCNRDEKTLQITVGITAKIPLVKKLKKKFVEEAQSLCSLDHPNIVRISDVFEENGTAYYVMDYIDGSSLQDLVNKRGSLPESEAVVYIRQVADALKYVHSLNRLHLDIKPGNIMVDNKGRAILIDFGTAKQYDEEAGENTSTLLGKTPGYAPLEQMGNDVVKFLPSTDIYALGATLYKLLTGVTPPSASLLASGETLEIPTSLSAYTRNAILQSMQINKMKRPQSIEEFLDLFASSKDESTIIEDDEEDTFVNNESTRTGTSAWQEEEARRQREFEAKAEREAKASEKTKYHAEESEQKSREETVRPTFEEERTKVYEEKLKAEEKIDRKSENLEKEQTNGKITWRDRLFLFNFFCLFFFPAFWLFTFISPFYYPSDTVFITWIIGGIIASVLAFGTGKKHTSNDISLRECIFPLIVLIVEFIIVGSSLRSIYDKEYDSNLTAAEDSTEYIIGTLDEDVNENGDHDWVDLGLPSGTKWATMNIGATSPIAYGYYFAWGETRNKNIYSWETLKYCLDTSGVKFSKYVTDGKYGNVDGKRELDLCDDAAYVNWGKEWRTPSKAQLIELCEKCTWNWLSNQKGYNIVGPNGNSIFMPAAGDCEDAHYSAGAESYGSYWSRTLSTSENSEAYHHFFASGSSEWFGFCGNRSQGRSIRAVRISE